MQNDHYELKTDADSLVYTVAERPPIRVAWPQFSVEGETTKTTGLEWQDRGATPVADHVTEYRHAATIAPGLTLTVVARVADDSPIVRFRYELAGAGSLTKPDGNDRVRYARLSLPDSFDLTEVRLSEWIEFHHSYELNEVPVGTRAFAGEQSLMGPVIACEGPEYSLLLAYEHGSTYPDAFLSYDLAADRSITLAAVKGNYCAGAEANGFRSVWFLLGATAGTKDDLAAELRYFLLRRQSLHDASRVPHVFYNTWNYQERRRHWHGKPYLDEMHQERMLREIDVAHRMGIEVFVIDAGWFRRTGDWQPNLDRFPDGLRSVRHRLDHHGMKLGLWFDNSAAVESAILRDHLDCRCSSDGTVWDAHVVWETEPAHRMCLVSRYWEAFAAELIRLNRELGVTYFKWDAIGQYGCTDSGHMHGTASNTPEERADSYAFQLPLFMTRIVEKLSEACPDAIVDFDVTESGRAVGLAFLSAGKFFLINNGPYGWNYDIPQAHWPQGNPNLFFHPGPARTWVCRQPLTYDTWVPMNLFLTHYLPDDGAANQINGIASLILGQNGIWGDLPAISDEGVDRFSELLGLYAQVRDDVASAPPVRTGMIGGCPEIHEKINPHTGRGVVVLFASMPGEYSYITERTVSDSFTATPGARVTRLSDGRAEIAATFAGRRGWGQAAGEMEWARVVFFGVS